MAEIGFYHLTRIGLEQALPRLLGRTLAAGERALVLCGGPERVAALDAALWLATEPDWLPHGTDAMGHAALQPIWITEDPGPPANAARFLFLVDGTETALGDRYARVFDLFDGGDESAVAAARSRWLRLKQDGHALTYWQQTDRGWERAS